MEPALPLDTDRIEAGRQLGHDFFCHTHLAPEPTWDAAVLEGFCSARARHLKRRPGDRFVRKWLQVRGNALRRGRIVDGRVTPSFIMQLDVDACPILRMPMTHGSQGDSDWSVDRLNNDSAYAPGNLAIISVRANQAKGDHCFTAVHARATALEHDDSLTPGEWMRMASLMLGPCFVEQPGMAPVLPLLTPLPPLTVRSATQMIQYTLTANTRSAAQKNATIKALSRHCTNSHARSHIAHLAELIHLATKTTEIIWDVWQAPRIMQAFLSLRASVPAHTWAALGETASMLAGGKPVARDRIAAWHLHARGRYPEYWRY